MGCSSLRSEWSFASPALRSSICSLSKFWALCQGANVMNPSTELLILGIVDIVFISAFCIVSRMGDAETALLDRCIGTPALVLPPHAQSHFICFVDIF